MHPISARRAAALALGLLAGPALHASPTPNEFEACHKLAAAVLRHCLDEAPGRLDAACWQQSRERTTACYADVRASPAQAQERARAARRAMENRGGAAQGEPAR